MPASASDSLPGMSAVRTDTLSPAERSKRMSLVRARDTGPEREVRKVLTELGYRYRLQYGKLPGRPDIAFPGRRKALWVHGCFWHRHPGCKLARLPKSRREFWTTKLEGNRERDQRVQAEVKAMGWRISVVWECELRNRERLSKRLREFLDDDSSPD